MIRRQHEGEFHAYPEHRHGLDGMARRLLWRLGFDPLTVYERLAQVRVENAYWKDRLAAANGDTMTRVQYYVRYYLDTDDVLTLTYENCDTLEDARLRHSELAAVKQVRNIAIMKHAITLGDEDEDLRVEIGYAR